METAKVFETGRSWETFLEGLNGFTDDFFPDGREQDGQQVRESL